MSEKVIGFVCSALVHPDAVGRIYASFYEQGAKDMQMQAVFAEPPVPKTVQTEPETRSFMGMRVPKKFFKERVTKDKTAKQMVYDAIMAADGKPVSLAEMQPIIMKAGFSPSAVSVSLHDLMQKGKVKRTGPGAYALAKRVSSNAPLLGSGALSPLAMAVLTAVKAKANGQAVNRTWVNANSGIPRNSIGPQLHQLVKKGYLKRPSPNTYQIP